MCTIKAEAYWQQSVSTTIKVVLDDEQQTLHAYERLVYTNNAPDTLHYIILHLWPNAYANDRTAFSEAMVVAGKTDFYYAKEADRGAIDSLHFTVNGQAVDYSHFEARTDVIRIDLPQRLLPGDSVLIETPFRVKIPKVYSRLGHKGQAYYISQWFPKPAVFDQEGWHPLSYLDQGEFYSEFGSYDVTISVPENYIVMATGNLQTEAEILWQDSVSALSLPVDTFYQSSFPKSSERFKTIRFTEQNIHDFAWFADKRWILRKEQVKVDGNDSSIALFAAFLPKEQAEWKEALELLKHSLKSYSKDVGTYPYKTLKAVEGQLSAGGGMEYPTIALIDQAASNSLVQVLVHEVGHNWFYGIVGSNERDYPWMDEGLNTFYEQKTTQSWLAQHSWFDDLEETLYFEAVAQNLDQSLLLHATEYTPLNYGIDVYQKTALFLQTLENYMGELEFENGMKYYFTQWRFRHPYPNDFRNSMQAHSSKNLNWFFEGMLYSKAKMDLKIKKVRLEPRGMQVQLKNKSGIALPVQLSLYGNDSLVQRMSLTPFLKDTIIHVEADKPWDIMSLGGIATDFNLSNNQYRRKALFHKGHLVFKPAFGLNRTPYRSVFVLPLLQYNVYNGWGLGLLLHNLCLPQNRFQYAIAPIYSFKSKDFNGLAALSYNWYPRRIFQEIRLQTNIKTFAQGSSDLNINHTLYARYFKVAPFVTFIFKQANPNSKISRSLTLKQYQISEQYFEYKQNLNIDSLYRPSIATNQHAYWRLSYLYRNDQTFHPYCYQLDAQIGESFMKLGVSLQKRIDYDMPHKSFYIRAYAGKFITTNTQADNQRYYLNTAYSGQNDYLYDGLYLGRNQNDGLGAAQISIEEGGAKIPTNLYVNPIGRSGNWLAALNLKTDLPLGKIPLRVYADFATFADAKNSNPSANSILFNAGLEFNLFHEAVSLYLPLVMSTDWRNYLKEMYPENRVLKSIRCSFNLQNFNWLRSNEQLLKLLTN